MTRTIRSGLRSALAVTILLVSAVASRAADEPSDFARWEKSIAAFEEADKKSPPPKNAILFVGSSSIRLWDLKTSFPDRATINRGFGGSQIVDSTHFADRIVIKHRPRLVLLYAGDNDVAKGKSAETVHRDFRAFVKTVHAALPKTKIVFIAIKPSTARWKLSGTMKAANDLIAADCAKDKRLAYGDIWTPMLGDDGKPLEKWFVKDGLHLNPTGYELWAKQLRPLLD